ncbi:MAG: c-type cytochrome [Gammaproteobacteria bacterium]
MISLRVIVTFIGITASLLTATAGAESVDDDRARQNYILNCQGCHLGDGSGSPGAVPNVRDFLGYFIHVPGGRDFIVQVPGAANSALDDEQLAEVMNWMLLNFSRGQLPVDFVPYSAEEVSRLRQGVLADVQNPRAELILKIEEIQDRNGK